MPKRRKQVYIEDYQEATLKQLAGKRRQPEAMLIREALDGFLGGATVAATQDLAGWQEERRVILARMSGKRAKRRRKWNRDEIHDRR